MSVIYLDHNSTTNILEPVLKKMIELNLPLNSSSSHQLGRKAEQLARESREVIRKELEAKNYEVIFTSNATESNNLAIFGSNIENIIISEIEHPAVFNCRPEKTNFFELSCLNSGVVDAEHFKKIISGFKDKPFMASIMLANNETGAIQPIKELAKITHQNGGIFHSDLAQATGKIKIDLEDLNIDLASISSHKIGGPPGVGALMVRKGIEINPIIFGGGQEKFKRSGTLNIPGIVGFALAISLVNNNLDNFSRLSHLRDHLENELIKIAGDNLQIAAKNVTRLANTSFIGLKDIDSQTQLINFDLNNICISAGSACSSGSTKKSRVLKAMNFPENFGAIRVSLGPSNTKAEIDKFISVWKEFYQRQNK